MTWLVFAVGCRSQRCARLASGDFDYYQWEILEVETNRTSLWGEDGGSGGANPRN